MLLDRDAAAPSEILDTSRPLEGGKYPRPRLCGRQRGGGGWGAGRDDGKVGGRALGDQAPQRVGVEVLLDQVAEQVERCARGPRRTGCPARPRSRAARPGGPPRSGTRRRNSSDSNAPCQCVPKTLPSRGALRPAVGVGAASGADADARGDEAVVDLVPAHRHARRPGPAGRPSVFAGAEGDLDRQQRRARPPCPGGSPPRRGCARPASGSRRRCPSTGRPARRVPQHRVGQAGRAAARPGRPRWTWSRAARPGRRRRARPARW